MITRIQRLRTKGWRAPPDALYIGRPSIWGNVFKVERWGRHLAVVLYRIAGEGGWNPTVLKHLSDRDYHDAYALRMTWLKDFRAQYGCTPAEEARYLPEGTVLMDWCKPEEECHGDVIIDWVRTP